MPRLGTLSHLAVRDLAHGWLATMCLGLGGAVALAPLLLLYGLNFGFVTGLLAQLREDPRMRELRPVGQHELSADWFDEMGADPRIAFLLPRTRYLSSTAIVRGEGGVLEVEMIPTAENDPLLDALATPAPCNEVVLTESVAARSGAAVGGEVQVQIARRVGQKRESHRATMRVVGVLKRDMLERDAIFLAPPFVLATEAWREQGGVESLDCEGASRSERTASYASFRLFARDVRDVPSLRSTMIENGIDVRTRAEAISNALAIESGLGWVFLIVTALASSGFLLTLGFHLAASVVEKERELSILRLLGFSRFEVSLMPMFQGAMIAAGSAIVAGLAIKALQGPVNRQLDGIASFDGDVSKLLWTHVGVAVAASVVAGALAGGLAGRQAAILQIAKGLRRD